MKRFHRTTAPIFGLLMLLALALAAQGDPAGRANNKFGRSHTLAKPRNSIRIACYNMLNLFDHVDDPNLTGDHDDMKLAVDENRCRGMAQAIMDIDADIIALEEIESLEALTWFRDTYLPKAGYTHLASLDAGYYRGVEQSIMSRFPITDAKVWPHTNIDKVKKVGPGWSEVPEDKRKGLEMQRSPLMVDIQVSKDYALTIFVMHHKAGRNTRYHRESEAVKTLEFIAQRQKKDPARNIMVMGDFNAAPWDKSLRVYLEAGFVDTLAHRIIPRWKDPDPEEPDLYKTHESGRTLDYILMNSAAYRELVIGSAHVYGTLFDEDYDWRKDPYPKGYAADHYPVVIDIMPKDKI